MYLSEKPRPIDFYKEEGSRDMMIEVVSNGGGGETADLDLSHHHHHPHQHSQMVLGESSGGEEQEVRAAAAAASAPKKRAETWVQDETRCLIALRRETDGLFNTSKSNKHLWDQISAKMRDRGFDRSPTMCTDKWRNLLKEFKKAKHHRDRGSGSASAKMLYYKEIEEILRERGKNSQYKSPTTPPPPPPQTPAAAAAKVDSFMQFSDKGIDDASISFGQVEACGRQVLNPERRLDHDGHPLAITAAEAVAASGVPPWNWRDTPGNGGDGQSYGGTGKVISVKWGDYTRRIGIDGTAEAIKEAIKSAFRLRTRRAFWLEDEDQVIRSLDKNMPLGNYTLHLDEGLVIKVCLYDGSDHMPMHTEEKIFFTEDDYRDFLTRRGWTCLREFDGYNVYYNMDDLRPGAIYRGVS